MKFSTTSIACLLISTGMSSVAAFSSSPSPIQHPSTRMMVSPLQSTAAPSVAEDQQTMKLMAENQKIVDQLGEVAPALSDMERLRFALQFETLEEAKEAMASRQQWTETDGKAIVEAAEAAVAAATASEDGKWDNAPVYDAAPHADIINKYITPKSVMTLSTPDGDLVYVIRASQIDDKELMDQVSVEQVCDYFLYAKEIHNRVANARSLETGRLCKVIFANDISGVRKAPDSRFSKALTSSSDQYETLYPSLAGPTMILNLPFVLQAFVGLLKPLFPKSVQKRLVFTKAPVLKSLTPDLTPLANNPTTRQEFVKEVQDLLP